MKSSVLNKTDEGFGSPKLGPIDEDPILARCQMGLAQLGSECLVGKGAAVGASKGGEIMGLLAMMSSQGQHGGGMTTTISDGSSAGPAIAVGAGGLAAGLGVGAAALCSTGSGKKDEKKEEKPKTDTGTAGTPPTKTPPTTTAATTSTDTKKEPTPPPGGGTVPEPPTAAPPPPKVEDTSGMGFSPNGLTLTPLSTPTELSLPTSK